MDTTKSTTPLLVQSLYQFPTLSAAHVVLQTTIPGNPVTKGRARFYDGKVYTPKKTRLGQQHVTRALKAAYGEREPNRIDDLGLSAIFYLGTRQRCDIDNFLKLLLDACNGLLWGDDLQVVELSSKVIRSDPRPRIELLVYRLSVAPLPVCETCHGALPQRGIIVKRISTLRFCSKACYDVAQQKGRYVSCSTCNARLYRQNEKLLQDHWFCNGQCRSIFFADKKICRHCQKEFHAQSSILRHRAFCSDDCRIAWHEQQRPPSQKPGNCPVCQGPSSRKGQRCHRCHVISLGYRAPFTQQECQEIYALWQGGMSQNALGLRYGVPLARIYAIVHLPPQHMLATSQEDMPLFAGMETSL